MNVLRRLRDWLVGLPSTARIDEMMEQIRRDHEERMARMDLEHQQRMAAIMRRRDPQVPESEIDWSARNIDAELLRHSAWCSAQIEQLPDGPFKDGARMGLERVREINQQVTSDE